MWDWVCDWEISWGNSVIEGILGIGRFLEVQGGHWKLCEWVCRSWWRWRRWWFYLIVHKIYLIICHYINKTLIKVKTFRITLKNINGRIHGDTASSYQLWTIFSTRQRDRHGHNICTKLLVFCSIFTRRGHRVGCICIHLWSLIICKIRKSGYILCPCRLSGCISSSLSAELIRLLVHRVPNFWEVKYRGSILDQQNLQKYSQELG